MIKTRRLSLFIFLLLSGMLPLAVTHAAQTTTVTNADSKNMDTVPPSINVLQYSQKGADTCIKCHDEDTEYPVLDIFKTKHAMKADARTPFATLQC